MTRKTLLVGLIGIALFCVNTELVRCGDLDRIGYENPGLVIDLGVGLWAWPAPMDFDGDGDMDLVVACPDKPYNGLYFFENPGGDDAGHPVFRPAVRLGPARSNVTVSYSNTSWPPQAELFTPARRHGDFRNVGIGKGKPLAIDENPADAFKRKRANQWQLVDLDLDGKRDLVIGIGDWEEYGWDDAYDTTGTWTNGPLHGYVYVARNRGSESSPDFATPERLRAGGEVIDVYGMPSPNFADFDSDGDVDLICGEFVDGLTWFENVGQGNELKFVSGRPLRAAGSELQMELCMIVPVAVDFDGDGDHDLVVGQEDGRVALVENLGKVEDRMPKFAAPVFFQQEADRIKVGALVTPVGFDWDGDGDEDLVCGDTAGFVNFVERLDGETPRWAAPKRMEAGGKTLRIEAGKNGSIQGPCEAKWGYTVLSVADWDHDGVADVMLNSIWGAIEWYRGVERDGEAPTLEAGRRIEVEWEGEAPKPAWNWWEPKGNQLVTQWRTTPFVEDLDRDGLNDLVMLDHEGYLAWYRRAKERDRLVVLPPQRVFREASGELMRLNPGQAGKSGRRKFVMVDFDGDGKRDLIANSRPNVEFWRNVGAVEGDWRFKNEGAMSDRILAGHTTSPTMIDLDGDGQRELVVGAEDGLLYRYVSKP